MSKQPPITVSSLDLQRIGQWLRTASAQRLPGIDAPQAELDRASVVEPVDMPPDIVTLNSTVRFCNDTGGRKLQLRVLEVLRQPEALGEYHR